MEENGLVKVIVIGDSLVGKTSFIHRYVNKTFRPEYKSTIGVDFALKIIPWTDPSHIKIQLWDIAGQERFTYMTRAYYKDAKGCILMFDITNKHSFTKVEQWKKDLDSKARLPDGSHMPCLLVANKSDLKTRQVDNEEIFKVCDDLGFIGWCETSAKDGIMVEEAIKYLLDIITGKSKHRKSMSELTDSIRLKPKVPQEKKCGC